MSYVLSPGVSPARVVHLTPSTNLSNSILLVRIFFNGPRHRIKLSPYLQPMRFKLLAEGSLRCKMVLGGLRCTGLVKRLPGIFCAHPAVCSVRLMYQIRASRGRGREETDNKRGGGGAQVPGRMSASHIHYSAPSHPPPSSQVVVVALCRGGIIRSVEALESEVSFSPPTSHYALPLSSSLTESCRFRPSDSNLLTRNILFSVILGLVHVENTAVSCVVALIINVLMASILTYCPSTLP